MPTLQCRICTKRYREFKIQVTPELTPARRRRLPTCSKAFRIIYGGEWGPVTFPAFKAGDSSLRGWNGGFDFRTPPPYCHAHERHSRGARGQKWALCSYTNAGPLAGD